MGLLGISLIVASVVYIALRPPAWLTQRLWSWHYHGRTIKDGPATEPRTDDARTDKDTAPRIRLNGNAGTTSTKASNAPASPTDLRRKPAEATPPSLDVPDGSTTPKASATAQSIPVPAFSLSDESSTSSAVPTPASPSTMMPPPPVLGRITPTSGRIPTLPQFPAANSAQRARGPAPNRGPSGAALSSGGLAPPPTHSSKPQKPSRKIILDPGHSPLDWARISGPNADLRGVDPSTPYLRVTPSMLKKHTGRKGKDAWMALNGKVYNVTPYAKFHPGGIPELMRGAAKDGTKLFGEIHPWVNYETMLSACLVGLLVEESEDASQESKMDQMD